MFARRAYATAAGAAKKQRFKYDPKMIRPLVFVVLFGSQVINVMDQRKRHEDLERRYQLKKDVLVDMIARASKGEVLDVDSELKLVNKLFAQYAKSKYIELDKKADERAKLEQLAYEESKKSYYKEDDLESTWNDILKDINEPVVEKAEQTKQTEQVEDFGEYDNTEQAAIPATEQTVASATATSSTEKTTYPSDSKIVTEKHVIDEQLKAERELKNYVPATDSHIIVEIPGDYVSAAEDTRVTKFL